MFEFETPAFPSSKPAGYGRVEGDLEFDAIEHLALEFPSQRISLKELGYHTDEIKECATEFAVSSPAQLLSSAGVEACIQVSRELKQYTRACERVENMVRGGVYRSDFLRGLCTSKVVTEYMSDVFGIKVAPHSMPSQLGHLNFAPSDINKAVDKWHYDTLELDYIMMVTDPTQILR